MSILDKLIEKKDITIYIDSRIGYLKVSRKIELERQPPKKKELIMQRFNGRIKELEYLKNQMNKNKLKEKAKKWFKYTKEDE